MRRCVLTFGVPLARVDDVRQAIGAQRAQARERTVSFDTEADALAARGLALQWQQRGTACRQLLWRDGDGVLLHDEHAVATAARDAPAVDPTRHRHTTAGRALTDVLAAAAPGGPLQPRRVVEVTALSRRAHHAGAVVEFALCEGQAGPPDRALQPVTELRLALLRGPGRGLFELARHWQAQFALWLLPHGADAPRRARDDTIPGVAAAGDAPTVVHGWLGATLPALLRETAPLAVDAVDVAALHQTRVALRRLRTVLRLARQCDVAVDADWEPQLARSFRELSATRDRDALLEWLPPALQAAGLAMPGLPPPGVARSPAAVVRDPALQRTLLWLLEFAHTRPRADALASDFARRAGRFIDRLHARIARDARHFASLSPARQHALRKRVKRLRYAVEYCAEVMPAQPLRRHLRTLRAAQVALGRLQDIGVAIELLAPQAPRDPVSARAVDWLRHEARAAVRHSAKALRRVNPPPPLRRQAQA